MAEREKDKLVCLQFNAFYTILLYSLLLDVCISSFMSIFLKFVLHSRTARQLIDVLLLYGEREGAGRKQRKRRGIACVQAQRWSVDYCRTLLERFFSYFILYKKKSGSENKEINNWGKSSPPRGLDFFKRSLISTSPLRTC